MNLFEYLVFLRTGFWYRIEPSVKTIFLFIFVRVGKKAEPMPEEIIDTLKAHLDGQGYKVLIRIIS